MFDYNVCKLLKILGSKIQKIASQKKKRFKRSIRSRKEDEGTLPRFNNMIRVPDTFKSFYFLFFQSGHQTHSRISFVSFF